MAQVSKQALFEEIKYEPHPRQSEYHRATNRFRVACCGRRFGKSTMAGRDLEAKLFMPNRRFWIVGPTYDLGEKEFRVIWDDLIIGKALGRNKKVKRAYNKKQGTMYIEFPWQTRVEVRSAEHPENLVGESLDWVIMSEAAKHKRETFEKYIRPALADRLGGADFPTTPEGFNWLYDMWRLGQNPDFGNFVSWRFPSWENPYVYPGGRQDPEIIELERTTTPEWFMQEIGADFASFVGKIYGEFEESMHVRKIDYNPSWQNFVFFDWGFVNPMAALDVMIDPQDNVYVWREYYKPYMRLEEALEEMKAREQPPGYNITCCFGDAADPEAVMTVNQKFAACWADPEAKTNWRAGVDRVKTFLKPRQTGEIDEYGTPKYEPKLFVSHNCPNFIREINNYRTVENVNSATRESGARSAAQKQDDHTLDALRYGLVHIFDLGLNSHLTDVYNGVMSLEESPTSETFSEGGFFTMSQSF